MERKEIEKQEKAEIERVRRKPKEKQEELKKREIVLTDGGTKERRNKSE